jgi:hypothetical protein
MLGRQQFTKSFSEDPTVEANGVSKPELALLDVLQNFFKGTAVASFFGTNATDNNNGEMLSNAPINYLQIWEADFIYAYGWQNCSAREPTSDWHYRCKVADPRTQS